MEFQYRRKNERKKYSTNVSYVHQDRSYPGTLKDISVGGCFIITSWVNHFSPGDIILVNIPYATKREAVKKRGRITWINNEGLGIEFY